MNIKWIVSDMDGTLLNSRDQITEKTRKALLACQKKGIRLILASGRSYIRLLPYARQLRLAEFGGDLIEVNGLALNRLKSGERTVLAQLNRADKEILFAELQRFQVEIQGYEDEALYYWIPEWQRPYKERECRERGYLPGHPLAAGAWSWVTDNINNYPKIEEICSVDEMPDRLNKINCTDNPDKIQEVYTYLSANLKNRYEIVRTAPRLIEIAPKGITKGRTLRNYMEEEGIKTEEVMAFGDGENDIDMFRNVAYSIAMGNAENYVKEAALDVTGTNDRDGIVSALKKYGVL